ncbi:terminase [Streptomyces sp. NPDC037389]|uniref:terminase n=1 Tax=Streptomyces sp. NPDC037389 TaxID=3155369 RepID=UPI0033DA6570
MVTATASVAEEDLPPDVIEPVALGPTWKRDESGRFVLPELSLGWHVLSWTAQYLQHSAGQPWRYTPEQARFTLWYYAIDPVTGRFLYRDAVFQRLKGHGKDPLAATYAATEFVGPCRLSGQLAGPGHPSGVPEGQPLGQPHPEAWVQLAAVTQSQTRNTMTIFPSLFSLRAVEEFSIDLGKEVIYAHKGRARIEAVTSSPRALEGARASWSLINEPHHWLATNSGHEMAAVIERNATKSADGSARTLAITNSYEPGEDSVAERTREAWEAAQAGRAVDTGLLYDSLEAPPGAKLNAAWAPKVIEAVRGDATWLDIDRIVASILDVRNPASRSRRFWYNQVVAAEDAWLAPYEWDACARPDLALSDGDEIVVFLDCSKSDDATGLVACRMSDGHVGTLGVWQRPPQVDVWNVPREEVDGIVDATFARFRVLAFFADPGTGEDQDDGRRYWDRFIDAWAERYGARLLVHATTTGTRRHAVEWDMGGDRRRQEEFTAAVERTHVDILERQLTHDGHKVARTHVRNARRRVNAFGVTIGKEHRASSRKIDLAVCMVGARMLRRLVINSPKYGKRPRARGKGRVIVLG